MRAGGVVAVLRRGTRLAPRILDRATSGAVRAAFVPTQAGPLAGDSDRARIVVGPGATLVIEPVAATLALPGDALTTLALDVTVGAGGRIILDEGPLIVAAGASVRRATTIELEAGALAAVRETVILGRDGEPPGALDATLRVTLGGHPLLSDGLRITDSCGSDAHVARAPGHRVLATVAICGERPHRPQPGTFALERPGALLRASGASLATVEQQIVDRWHEWAGQCASFKLAPDRPLRGHARKAG